MRGIALLSYLVSALAAADLAVTNVTVIDGTGGPNRVNQTVLVADGRITAIQSAQQSLPSNYEIIDATGKFLMPGWIDAHIHLIGAGQWRGLDNPAGVDIDMDAALSALHGFLYVGVTSVYDAGNNPDLILEMRRRERAGEIVSPRIFASGHALSWPGSWMASTFHGVGVPDWPDTKKVLDAQIALKPDIQKLVMERFGMGPNPLAPSLPEDVMAKMVAYLKQHGVRTSIHAVKEDLALAAVEAGIDTLAHPVSIARVNASFTDMLATRRVPVASTLAVFDEIIRLGEDPTVIDTPLNNFVMGPEEIAARQAKGPPLYASMGWTTWFKALSPYLKENVRNLYDAGGVVVVATDRSHGPLYLRELQLLAELGIPAAALVRMGTLHGAMFLGLEDELGTISVGKLADLVLLEADPSVDIDNAAAVVAVIKNGRIIDRSRLALPGNQRLGE
ncbi:MAG: amidohydrolase family protein [Gammaproteobacteria bacterium]